MPAKTAPAPAPAMKTFSLLEPERVLEPGLAAEHENALMQLIVA
jgi:hypothetical protein